MMEVETKWSLEGGEAPVNGRTLVCAGSGEPAAGSDDNKLYSVDLVHDLYCAAQTGGDVLEKS